MQSDRHLSLFFRLPMQIAAKLCMGLAALAILSSCTVPSSYMGIDLAATPAPLEARNIQVLAHRSILGDKHAQLDLGMRFEEGRGVERDLNKARELYRKAASDKGGRIWVYSPSVGNGTSGRVIPVDTGPKQFGLAEAKRRLERLRDSTSSTHNFEAGENKTHKPAAEIAIEEGNKSKRGENPVTSYTEAGSLADLADAIRVLNMAGKNLDASSISDMLDSRPKSDEHHSYHRSDQSVENATLAEYLKGLLCSSGNCFLISDRYAISTPSGSTVWGREDPIRQGREVQASLEDFFESFRKNGFADISQEIEKTRLPAPSHWPNFDRTRFFYDENRNVYAAVSFASFNKNTPEDLYRLKGIAIISIRSD